MLIDNYLGDIKNNATENAALPVLLTMKELCDYLGLGRTTVTYMLQRGDIPHMKIKGKIRVFATDLVDYLKKQYIDSSNPL